MLPQQSSLLTPKRPAASFSWNDPNMIEYAKSHGVKLLQTFNGCIDKDLSNATVRAAVIKNALSEAPAPYGTHKQANNSVDGLFCACGNALPPRCAV